MLLERGMPVQGLVSVDSEQIRARTSRPSVLGGWSICPSAVAIQTNLVIASKSEVSVGLDRNYTLRYISLLDQKPLQCIRTVPLPTNRHSTNLFNDELSGRWALTGVSLLLLSYTSEKRGIAVRNVHVAGCVTDALGVCG